MNTQTITEKLAFLCITRKFSGWTHNEAKQVIFKEYFCGATTYRLSIFYGEKKPKKYEEGNLSSAYNKELTTIRKEATVIINLLKDHAKQTT